MAYEAQEADFGDGSFDAQSVISLGKSGDRFYAACDSQESDAAKGPAIYTFTKTGDLSDTVSVPAESTQSLSAAAAMGDGGFVAALSSYTFDDAAASGTEDAAADLSGTFYLLYLSEDGTQKWKAQVTKDGNGKAIDSIDSVYCADGKIYVGTPAGLMLISTDDGTVQKQVYSASEEDSANQYFVTDDGSIVVLRYTDDGQVFSTIDENTGTIRDDSVAVPSGVYMQGAFSGNGKSLYAASDSGIYKVDMEEKTFTKVMDFIASGLDATGVQALAAFDDTTMAAVLSDNDGNTQLCVLTKAKASDKKDKKTLTVGGYSLDYSVRKAIVAFNKAHDDFQIEIKDYTSYDSDEGTEGITQLNTDIISGKAPDIMVLDNDMPVASYIEKGVLLSLDDYLDSDGDIQKEDYLTNISDAFRTDGKTYEIIPAFTLETVAGKTSDIGDGKSFTMETLRQLQKEKNIDSAYLFGLYDRDTLLDTALSFTGNEYVDLAGKKSTFDSDSFRDLLGLVKECPDTISDEQYSEDSSTFYRSGKALLYISDLTSFSDYQTITQGMFGDSVTFTGFPTDKNSGIVIRPQMQLAISSSAEDPDACWDFLKYFLQDDFQSLVEQNFACWPVSIKAVDALGEEAKKNPAYTDEDGNEVEQPNEYYLGTESIELKPLTDEEVETVKNILMSASEPYYYDEDVEKIISEETGAYFEGQKSVEAVTDVIQNRVNTYIKENS